jgi:HD-GYP domain-containing protein (c-di-GMP phosphodiesterase class II)
MSFLNIPALLIILGAIIMLICIMKYQRNLTTLRSIIVTEFRRRTSSLSTFHNVLMIGFFLGYIVVAYLISIEASIFSGILIGNIFFFGAVFVLIGVLLQSDMLASIKKQHDNIVTAHEQLLKTQEATIFALAYQAELRDQETGKHLERTAQYVTLLAEALSALNKYSQYVRPTYIADLGKSAPLHDIGKVAIPDSILRKTDKLTFEEFEIIKKHCEYGTKVLIIADEKLNFQSYLSMAIQVVGSHHERWDGTGYPQGLREENIPLSARIMAIADVYDALRSERCYKKGFTHEVTCRIIEEKRGSHFDPEMVDLFVAIENKFNDVFNDLHD